MGEGQSAGILRIISDAVLFCLNEEEIAIFAFKSKVPNRKAWESVPIGTIPGRLCSQQERQVQAHCITQVLQLENEPVSEKSPLSKGCSWKLS